MKGKEKENGKGVEKNGLIKTALIITIIIIIIIIIVVVVVIINIMYRRSGLFYPL